MNMHTVNTRAYPDETCTTRHIDLFCGYGKPLLCATMRWYGDQPQENGHGTSIVWSRPEVKMYVKGEVTLGKGGGGFWQDHSKGEECQRFMDFHNVGPFEVSVGTN